MKFHPRSCGCLLASALLAASAAFAQDATPSAPAAPPPPPPPPATAQPQVTPRRGPVSAVAAAARAARDDRAAQIAAPAAPDPASYATLVSANNRFALDLFRQVTPGPNENVFLSPYSISAALAMTWAGAKGDTAAQMARVLHFFDAPDAAILANFPPLQQALARAQILSGAQLAIANSLWPEQNPEAPLRPDYLHLAQTNFAATITPVDFINQAAAATEQINAWVVDNTNGKINNLLHPGDVDANTRLVLVNAIYFKGAWTNIFSARLNTNADFHAADGSAIACVLMNNWQHTGYADITDAPVPCQVLSLSYSDPSQPYPPGLSFVAILPRAGGDLAALEQSLTAERLADWLGHCENTYVSVFLPKFKLEERYPLANNLKSMGVTDAFDSRQADFSGMNGDLGPTKLYISTVIHQTFVAVDEKGTEAAAATAVTMLGGAGPPQPPPIEFRADHPFLFLIRDNVSGSILFLGQLTNPPPLHEDIQPLPARRGGSRRGGPRSTAGGRSPLNPGDPTPTATPPPAASSTP